LSANNTDDDFVAKFKELYPQDWKKVVARYEAHERLTPPGKSHPMARPYQYVLNVAQKYRKRFAHGEELDAMAKELAKPRPETTAE